MRQVVESAPAYGYVSEDLFWVAHGGSLFLPPSNLNRRLCLHRRNAWVHETNPGQTKRVEAIIGRLELVYGDIPELSDKEVADTLELMARVKARKAL
jgi:hypothetical protein